MREEENKNETPPYGPGCGCNEKSDKGSFSRSRWMIFAVIMVVAVAMVVRAATENDTGSAQTSDHMAKGRGSSAVSGDITNDKLMQAFVRAMNAGGGCCSSKKKK